MERIGRRWCGLERRQIPVQSTYGVHVVLYRGTVATSQRYPHVGRRRYCIAFDSLARSPESPPPHIYDSSCTHIILARSCRMFSCHPRKIICIRKVIRQMLISVFQVNVPKTRRTYCKGKDCKKHTQHKVTR